MHYLVVDDRFGTTIHVFLEADPRREAGFPGYEVRQVTIECPVAAGGGTLWRYGIGTAPMCSIGRHPAHLDQFREFGSDGAVSAARYVLIEPRYIGPSWGTYAREFRPGGA